MLSYIIFAAQLCLDPFIIVVAFLAGFLVKTHQVRVTFVLAFAIGYTLILRHFHDPADPRVTPFLLMICRFCGGLVMTYAVYGVTRLIRGYVRKN